MSKLPEKHSFLDLSDYGRPVARYIAFSLKETAFTPIHVTLCFMLTGILGIVAMYHHYYLLAAFLFVFKSILDAADGELARIRNTPSYTGRYLDSVFDILLNFMILGTIGYMTNGSVFYTLLAFFGLQLQGTLYNYYYVILRNIFNGDTTSRVFETQTPVAMKGESQRTVTFLYRTYLALYGVFDRIIYALDRSASKSSGIPSWLMTTISTFGLGFQLLVIGILLVFNQIEYIIPFFTVYSLLIFVFIGIRKVFYQ
ncbi:MAG: CDP-alcohol phosphatidyltransferase family protein [Bacteroidota bacterium]